jgi:hypothetical protein
MRRKQSEIMEVDLRRFKDVAGRAKASLDPEDAELIERVFDSYEYVASLIQEKNMSIAKSQNIETAIRSRIQRFVSDIESRDFDRSDQEVWSIAA